MFANTSINDSNLNAAAHFLSNNMNGNGILNNNNMMHLDNQVNNHLNVNHIYQNQLQLSNEQLQNQNHNKNYQLTNIIRNLNQSNLPTANHLYNNLNLSKLQLNNNNLVNGYQNIQNFQNGSQPNVNLQNGQLNQQQFDFLNQQQLNLGMNSQHSNNLSPIPPHLLNGNLNNMNGNSQLPLQPKQLPQHNIPNVFCNLKNQTPVKYQQQHHNQLYNTPSNSTSTFQQHHQQQAQQHHKQQQQPTFDQLNNQLNNPNNQFLNSVQQSNLRNLQQQQLSIYFQQQLNNQNNPNILNRNLLSNQNLINRNLFNVNNQNQDNSTNYFNSILGGQNLNNLNNQSSSSLTNNKSFINNLISTPNRNKNNLDYNLNNNNSSFTFNNNSSGSSLSNKSNSSSDNCLTSSTSSNENVQINGQLKNFKIIKQIGNGQFSVVYRAMYIPTGQYVALKCIRILELEDMKTRLDCINEISLLQRLDHPNIIKFYTSFVECNELYIVLELADCGDLAQLIKHFRKVKKTIPERRIWGYFRQVANGLLHMHENCVLHRDIKPPNVFITQSGVVKLGDLGLSKYYGSSCKGSCCCDKDKNGCCRSNKEKNNNTNIDTRAVLENYFNNLLAQKNKNNQTNSTSLGSLVKACTQQVKNNIHDHRQLHYKYHKHLMQDEASSLIGTPFYMSKERLSENCKYDSQSDVWSLGCILYEMAALQSPFYGEKLNLISLCQKIVSCNYPPLVNNYSVALRSLVAACLDSDPKKRPDIMLICDIAKFCSELSHKELQLAHLYTPMFKTLKVDEILTNDKMNQAKMNSLSPMKSNNMYSNMNSNGMNRRTNKNLMNENNNLNQNSMTTSTNHNNNVLNHNNNLNHFCLPTNQILVSSDNLNQKNYNMVNNNFLNNMTNDCTQFNNDLQSLENSKSFLKFWSFQDQDGEKSFI